MTALFFVTRHRWIELPRSAEGVGSPASMTAALREPLVWLQIVLFFLYVGLEFTVGQWSFTLLTESRSIRADIAGILVGSYYGAIGVGRVLSGAIAHQVGLDRLIQFSMLAVLGGTTLFAFGAPVEVGFVGLTIIGLGLAPIFPCMMAKTPERLGAGSATHAIGFQVSAGMLGAALVPGAAGLLVQKLGLELVAQFAVVLAVLLFMIHELILSMARRGP